MDPMSELTDLAANVLNVMGRHGPPQIATLFGLDPQGRMHVAALADGEPIDLARAMIKRLKLRTIVLAVMDVDETLVVLHGESGQEHFNRLYALPTENTQYVLVSEDLVGATNSNFDNLLGSARPRR